MATQNLHHSLSNSSTKPLSATADRLPAPSKPNPNNHRKSASKRRVLVVLAVSILIILIFFLISFLLWYFRYHNHPGSPPEPYSAPVAQIQKACKATRFPDSCVRSLSQSGRVPPDPTSLQIVQSAVNISSENLKTVQSMIRSILDSSAGNQNRTDVANTCLQILSLAEYRTISAEEALTRGKIKGSRSWMSAALAYQYGCWSGLNTVNDTKSVVETISLLETLNEFSITTLSMMASYDNFGNDVALWVPPATERGGFWGKIGSGTGPVSNEPKLGFPSGLTEDATVCKDGTDGCYLTVQEAVNSAPDNNTSRFVIRIREGVYEETVRVPFEKKKVVFIGDGRGKTVITGSLNVGQPGMSTYNSATVGVLGDGFMARDLTIQNTAGANAHQAVAFRSDSDFSLLENCELLGNQDTLYAHSLRQFYKSCRIVGNVDFIFGNSATVFHDCEILIAPRVVDPESAADNPIVAQGRTDPSQTTGFVFSNCTVNGTADYLEVYRKNPEFHKSYLGRPWKEFSRTVFLRCNLDAVVDPEGWMPWSGDFALKTLFFGEYKNSGQGYDASRRVAWSSQIPDAHFGAYSVENFIQADEWAVQ